MTELSNVCYVILRCFFFLPGRTMSIKKTEYLTTLDINSVSIENSKTAL